MVYRSVWIRSALAVLPVLLAAVRATAAALNPLAFPPGTLANEQVVIACYDVVAITAAIMLFGPIWTQR